MALDHLLQALERQAAETAAEQLKAARAEAGRIEAQAEEGLARRMTAGLEGEELALRADAERTIAAARNSHRRQVLEARERLLARIFARAEELLGEGGSDLADSLTTEVRQALDYLGGGLAVVHCPPSAVPRLRADLSGIESVDVQPDAALRAGFRVRAADGSVLVDHTPERRLSALRSRLAIELLRRIEASS
ncbi:MAG TPA: V-type ATP synthase subunit E [Gemmatimonadales bacterium]